MESEMVERVGLAICRAGPTPDDVPNRCNALCHMCLAEAKAAIQAMREPTDAMVRAGEVNQAYVGSTITTMWRSMISEATGEQHQAVAVEPGKSAMGEG